MFKMNGIITLIPVLVVCIWIVLRTRTVCGTGTYDTDCLVDCACCKDRLCGPNGYWSEGNCYRGCIDGYRGDRCYRKCAYPECAECPNLAYVCTKCKAGYYPGSSYNCSSKCPIGCKTCTSGTKCSECAEEYYNANGSKDCRYRYCPLHCKCEQNVCVLCKSGYYNISSSCISKCPTTCSSQDTCTTCREDKQKSEDCKPTTVIVMGVITALLLVVVICLIACIIVLKRRSTDRSPKGARVYMYSANETLSSNIEHRRNEGQTSAEQHAVYYNVMQENDDSNSMGIPQTSEYEKIESIQGQEHEYGHISSAV